MRALLRVLNPYLFLLPVVLILGFWIYRPFIQNIFYSFMEWNMLPTSEPANVGLRNYEFLLTQPDFPRALKNTFLYVLGMLPFSIAIPIFLAIATNGVSDRWKQFYRALFFLPMIMPPVVVSSIWRWLFHPTNGFINQVLLNSGLIQQRMNFLGSEEFAMISIIIIAGWKMIGFATILYSAALTGIDPSYYEAASIDNASKTRQLFTITLPLLSPTILFMLMVSILFTAQMTFVYINVLTQGGPAGSTTNVYYLMYTFGLRNFNVGMSAASAITFFIIFGVLALIMAFINRRYAFYDN